MGERQAEKKRLDVLLVEKGLAPSRERAQAQVMEGRVFVDGVLVDKPGAKVKWEAAVEVRGDAVPYASRGGIKLAAALDRFGIEVDGRTALDCGASTGGFTDCLLKRGAKKVYAVDVGYGQIDWRLRRDPRVVCLERTNIRYLTRDRLGECVDMATLDVSFISLTKVWPAVSGLVVAGGDVLSLVKPQFEVGRGRVGKKGVVRDLALHREVLLDLIRCAAGLGLAFSDVWYSPIRGPEGNIEFWLHLKNGTGDPSDRADVDMLVERTVDAAHRAFGGSAVARGAGSNEEDRHHTQS